MNIRKFLKTILCFASLVTFGHASWAEQAQVVSMNDAKFTKGWEDIEQYINAASFDKYKLKTMGSPSAPLTLYDISSLSCGHCGTFHLETFPKLKKDYVDTGKLRIVDLGIVFDQLSFYVKATTFATKNDQQYWGYLDLIFKNQQQWYSDNYQQEIDNMLKLSFIAQEDVQETLNDPKIKDILLRVNEYLSSVLKIESTPTFILTKTGHSPEQAIEKITGNQPDQIIAAIDKALQ